MVCSVFLGVVLGPGPDVILRAYLDLPLQLFVLYLCITGIKKTFLLIPCLFRFCWEKRKCAYKHQSRVRSSYQCRTCNVGLCLQWTPGQKLDPTMTKKGKVHTLLTLFCSLDVRLSVHAFGNCLHAFSS